MQNKLWLLFWSVVLLAGCESLVTDIPDAKLPKVPSKLVVQSFISPQNAYINVVVTESSPLFGESKTEGGVIDNATVKLSNGQREVTIPFDTESQLYSLERSKFQIEPGKTYYLTVTDGARSVKSSCTVPSAFVLPMAYEIDTIIENGYSFPDTILRLKMVWDDIPGQPNFYRMRAAADLEYSIPEGTTIADFRERRIRNHFNFNWEDDFGRNNLQSDANLDNTPFTSPTGEILFPKPVVYDFPGGNAVTVYPKCKLLSITMELFNTDENYYKYHRSLESRRSSENPFVEPSLIFSNIEGGLGCFAAFNSGQTVFRP